MAKSNIYKFVILLIYTIWFICIVIFFFNYSVINIHTNTTRTNKPDRQISPSSSPNDRWNGSSLCIPSSLINLNIESAVADRQPAGCQRQRTLRSLGCVTHTYTCTRIFESRLPSYGRSVCLPVVSYVFTLCSFLLNGKKKRRISHARLPAVT